MRPSREPLSKSFLPLEAEAGYARCPHTWARRLVADMSLSPGLIATAALVMRFSVPSI